MPPRATNGSSSATDPLRVAVMASGSGTNLQAILDQITAGTVVARVVVVISNNRKAPALERARQAGIEAIHWSEKTAGSHDAFTEGLLDILRRAEAELVVLAGYMKLVPKEIVDAYPKRMINTHPALLPKFGGKGFYGMRVHEAVIAAGETESGATVHFVDAEYDHGPVFLQRRVPVLPGDTPASLRERILAVEHELLPAAIARFANKHR